MNTSVAYIVFNRPAHTAQTFAVLRAQRPAQLFIIADGPRPGHPTDAERCAAVRTIIEQVDWPCEVHRNYAHSNMGLKRRVSSGLDWVFANVERAIVLEDDCVAHPDFFRFCDKLLEYYADEEVVSVITGTNFQNGARRGCGAYYFSKYNHCWGWATWRRAWQHYQGDLSFWPEWRGSDAWIRHTPDRVERGYWDRIFDRVYAGKIDSWAYPWMASNWFRNKLAITPNVNLISNIGFGECSTHTGDPDSHLANMEIDELGSMTHPEFVRRDIAADRYAFDHHFNGRYLRFPQRLVLLPFRVYRKLWRILRKLIMGKRVGSG